MRFLANNRMACLKWLSKWLAKKTPIRGGTPEHPSERVRAAKTALPSANRLNHMPIRRMVPEGGLEPHDRFRSADFKSLKNTVNL